MTTLLLDRLRALYPQSSRRSLKHWLVAGRVRVNGRVIADGQSPVGPADRVELGVRTRSPARQAFPAGLRLVHEDADLLVIDKPPGLLTIATATERERTAYRLVWAYLAAQRPSRRPFIVHRLDRETSGLVVFAKSPSVKRHLQAQFEARAVERLYIALVGGRVRDDRGTIESWLTQDRSLRVQTTRAPRPSATRSAAAREAITHYRVLERGAHTTLLELSLGTGRRRQIRVQLADLGHPIVGDLAHGSRLSGLGRLCLHAFRLQFTHPATLARVGFESPAPAVFARAAATL